MITLARVSPHLVGVAYPAGWMGGAWEGESSRAVVRVRAGYDAAMVAAELLLTGGT